MFAVLPRFRATLSPLQNLQDPGLLLRRLLLLPALALCLGGCHARPVAPAASLTPARSLTGPSSAVVQVQSSALYRQARQECNLHNYRHAADLLQTLARTPGLALDAVVFCTTQRDLCLKDAGLLPATRVVSASSATLAPADADCGPRALLLVCQQLGVKANLQTLRTIAGTNAEGTTLAGLQQAAQRLGLKAEGVQVSREALPDIALPALAWTDRRHFIALTALSGSGDGATATIHDPNRPGEETLSQEQLLQRCGGFLLLVHR